jgi:uncharacterized protein (TIGR02265 family)
VTVTANAERRIKGTLLLARMRYLQAHGPERVEAVLRRLSPEDQEDLRCMLLPSSWYSLGLLRRFEASIAAVLQHQTERELFLDIGRAAATANLTGRGAQRVYVQPGDPQSLLRHTPSIYASYFSFGHRTYESTGEHSAVVRTTKPFADANAEECLITAGWLARAIEITGGEDVSVVETACGVRGAPHCVFECSWRPRAGAAQTG